jgi:hypothetical protein
MSSLVWVGFVAFFVVALVVGVRLLSLARRTREMPELLMGIGVLGIGPVGFGFMVGAQFTADRSLELQSVLQAIGMFAVALGALAKYTFNWRVYHPNSKLAGAVVLCAGSFLFVSTLHVGFVSGFAPSTELTPEALTRSALQIGCLLWGSMESLRYWTKMRRRLQLGLADPVVTNRFLMWAIGAGAAGMGTAVGTVAQLVTGKTSMSVGWVMASSSAHGLVAAIAIALAFIPPTAYRQWIQRRSLARSAAMAAQTAD